jgi:hypothetical protein
MRIRLTLKRAVAFLLLAALPAVAVARMTLDVRNPLHSMGSVEIDDLNGSSRSHDHRLCLLVLLTPWSVTGGAPQTAAAVPTAQTAPSVDDATQTWDGTGLQSARAPPGML